jgi:Fe-S-cluster-containing dehydrogenase component/CRP-like cAMP-binding protein
MLLLKVLWGGKFVKEYRITDGHAVIGRLDNCDIVLNEGEVARFHALIEYQDSQHLLIDTSESGTLLNGEPVSIAKINQGDSIQIAGFLIEVIEAKEVENRLLRASWSLPFSDEMGLEEVEDVLQHSPFKDIDSTAFPSARRLRHILQNDSRITKYKNGDIIVRESDFGTTAFFILKGNAWYAIDSLPAQLLGRRTRRKKNFIEIIAQLWRRSSIPEYRDPSSLQLDKRLGQRTTAGSQAQVFIQDVEKVLKSVNSTVLEPGDIFGEISALGRTPRPATVISKGETVVLEMRWQGLRDLRRYSHEIKETLDALYRARSLEKHIRETWLFKGLSEDELRIVTKETVFETFGEFDWRNTYLKGENSLEEPIIINEGDYVNGVILIRSGFAKVTERLSEGAKTVRYLSRGDVFGFKEVAHNWRIKGHLPYQETLQAIGYADTLLVPTSVIERYVLPHLPESELPEILQSDPKNRRNKVSEVDPGLLEFLVSNRYHNGRSIMMIDLDRCTRCNDCVTACARSHDNNPRFIRDGKQYANFLVAHSCMHCSDPVCMIGCPTGAIHRDSIGGEIVINEVSCIGCSSCADSCPYDNIQMVSLRKGEGELLLEDETQRPVAKATKCDLCVDQLGGPACERSCPTEALKRVDISDFKSLVEWGKKG